MIKTLRCIHCLEKMYSYAGHYAPDSLDLFKSPGSESYCGLLAYEESINSLSENRELITKNWAGDLVLWAKHFMVNNKYD